MNLKIYIGYDSEQVDAFEVCRYSILSLNDSLTVIPIKLSECIAKGIFNRSSDQNASTEFTYTRFLVPYLNNYRGFALFVDSDFLFLKDPSKILEEVDHSKAVWCIKHPPYIPKTNNKMNNKKQTCYPRKNWSSLILWNLGRSEGHITVDEVSYKSPEYLHRFGWVSEESLGDISYKWGVLSGYEQCSKPNAIHYTDGGPWYDNYKNCEYSNLWNEAYLRFKNR